MGSPPQRFGWFNERGLPFVFLSVKVSEDSEGILRSVWRFPRIREGLRGAHSCFRGFGKHFAERAAVSEGSGRHFAERAAVSESSEGISRSAQKFPRIRKAFRGARSRFRGLGKHFAECAAVFEGSESIFPPLKAISE